MPKPLVIPKWGYFNPSKNAHRGLKRYLKYVAFVRQEARVCTGCKARS
jgi:hypothetical protein